MAEPGQDRLLADLATGLWRLRRRLLELSAGNETLRRPLRDAEQLLERLREDGVEVQDHTGTPYDATLSLTVAAFEPTPCLERESVLETLKPTVYHRGHRIQIGEVIVGLPE
jgi:hypothetical protein